MRINLLYIGFFTQQGAMADDYVLLGKYLAKKCNLFCLMGESDKAYKIDEAKRILRVSFSRRKILSFFNIKNYFKIWKYAKENQIDIVFFKTPNPANILVSCILKPWIQVSYCHDFKDHSGVSIAMQIIADLEKKILARNCDKIYVASLNLKKQMLNYRVYWKDEKIEVVPMGVLENLACVQENAVEDIDVLFFGRIEFYKGLDILIEAVKHSPKWNVCIAGKGDLQKIYGIEIIPFNVKFYNDYLPDEIVANLISRSKIIVLPYRDGTGTQIIQTVMYYGKTVVATNVGSFSEYINSDHDGIIIPPDDWRAVKQAIDFLLLHDDYRRKLGKEARRKANLLYDTDNIADLYIEKWRNMLFCKE